MNSNKLNNFKEKYINRKAEQLASDYDFIKGFTLDIMKKYLKSFNEFLRMYKNKINNFINDLKKSSWSEKNDCFLNQLAFINAIPRLIRIYDDEFEIDYIFIEANFLCIKSEARINIWKESLDELQQKIESKEKQYDISLKDLHKFGNFMVSFLSGFKLRKKIIVDLLNAELKSSDGDFEDLINPQFMKNQDNITNWNFKNSLESSFI